MKMFDWFSKNDSELPSSLLRDTSVKRLSVRHARIIVLATSLLIARGALASDLRYLFYGPSSGRWAQVTFTNVPDGADADEPRAVALQSRVGAVHLGVNWTLRPQGVAWTYVAKETGVLVIDLKTGTRLTLTFRPGELPQLRVLSPELLLLLRDQAPARDGLVDLMSASMGEDFSVIDSNQAPPPDLRILDAQPPVISIGRADACERHLGANSVLDL